MKKICLQTWVPLRKEPRSAAEMVSSMLFGEGCEVIETQGEWLHVKCDFDNYTGWIPENYLEEYSGQNGVWSRVLGTQGTSLVNNHARIHLSAGSNLPPTNEVVIRGEQWQLTSRENSVPTEPWQIAQGFLQVPYLWGGRSDCGMDCSGLTQVVFKIKGIQIPRDSAEQALVGTTVEFGKHQPNDLAFFHNPEGRITHVGIVSETGFIHASGRVREDDLTAEGIISRDNGKQTHALSFLKRWSY